MDTRLDPRRIGIGAFCLVGVYAVVIFIDESTVFRLTFAAICTAMAEAEHRKHRTAWLMVAQALGFAAIITAVAV